MSAGASRTPNCSASWTKSAPSRSTAPEFAVDRRHFGRGPRVEPARAYAKFVKARKVKDLPWPLAHSMILGPAYNYPAPRHHRPGPRRRQARRRKLIADAAWAAVKALILSLGRRTISVSAVPAA